MNALSNYSESSWFLRTSAVKVAIATAKIPSLNSALRLFKQKKEKSAREKCHNLYFSEHVTKSLKRVKQAKEGDKHTQNSSQIHMQKRLVGISKHRWEEDVKTVVNIRIPKTTKSFLIR